MPAGERSPRRSGPSTARTSPRIRRPVSAAGATKNFCGHCATACAPTAPIISRYSRIPALRRSPMRMRVRSKPISFHCRRCGRPTEHTTCPSPSRGAFCKTDGNCCFSIRAHSGRRRSAPKRTIAAPTSLPRSPTAANVTHRATGSARPSRTAFSPGTRTGRTAKVVPNITPDPQTGIGGWTEEDITTLLKTGQTPEFDFVGGAMGEVVRNTSRLDDADRRAIAVYLKSLPPIRSKEKAQ